MITACNIPNLRRAMPAPELPSAFEGLRAPSRVAPPSTHAGSQLELLPPAGNGANPQGALPAPPKEGTSPGPKPANSDVVSSSSGQLGVAEFFNDPLLTELVGQGMANNRELMALNY